jgi:hypothetical protein
MEAASSLLDVEAETGTMVSALSGTLNEGLWLMFPQDAGVGDFIVKARIPGIMLASNLSLCQLTYSDKQVAACKYCEGFHSKDMLNYQSRSNQLMNSKSQVKN